MESSRPRRLVLASSSPARLETLQRAGIDPEVVVSGVAEDGVEDTTPGGYVVQLAHRKAHAVARRCDGAALVLGCDSVLELDGELCGKPGSAAEAAQSWRRMRGRTGVLHTGHCLIDTATGSIADGAAATTVRFADVTDAEITAYVATGEPFGVAGGFTIDGLGGAFVEGVVGDHHNVIGLSLPLLRKLLGELDVPWPSLWSTRPPSPQRTWRDRGADLGVPDRDRCGET